MIPIIFFPDQIYIGNGEGLKVLGSGSSCLQNSNIPFHLHNLLHVPLITKNLLSLCKFALDNNVYFEFFPHFCTVKSQAPNEILLWGIVGADGLVSRYKVVKILSCQRPLSYILLQLQLIILSLLVLIPLNLVICGMLD